MSRGYLYDSPEECKTWGDHLTDCDDDGYCNHCGHQYSDEDDDDHEHVYASWIHDPSNNIWVRFCVVPGCVWRQGRSHL